MSTAIAAGLAAALLALLWVGVVTDSGLARVDPAVVGWLAATRSAETVAVMSVVAQLGSPAVMSVVMVILTATLAWRRRNPAVLVVGWGGLAVIGGADQLIKHVVARARPPLELHAVPAAGYSFPSGHATLSAGVVVLALWLTTAAATAGPPSPAGRAPGRVLVRWFAVVVAALFVVAVAASRLLLGVHYPSDVLAGWCVAVLADAAVLGSVAAFAVICARRAPRAGVPGPARHEGAFPGPGEHR